MIPAPAAAPDHVQLEWQAKQFFANAWAKKMSDPDHAWRYNKSFRWFGVRLYDQWQMPWRAHQFAMELIAMEAVDV